MKYYMLLTETIRTREQLTPITVPFGNLYPLYSMSSVVSLSTPGAGGYILRDSLIHYNCKQHLTNVYNNVKSNNAAKG